MGKVWIHTDGQCFSAHDYGPGGLCAACGNRGLSWALRWTRSAPGATRQKQSPQCLDAPENLPFSNPDSSEGRGT